jgi:hypothetical protein
MKKILIAVTILASFITTQSFAQTIVPSVISSAFQTSFKNAKDITWTEVNDLYKTEFNMNGQVITAFYNGYGKLVATSRNISSTQLPLALELNLKNNYSSYYIVDLFEVDNDNENAYYVTIQYADQKLQLKSTSNGNWNIYHKDIF